MRYSILGMPLELLEARLKKRRALCVVAASAALALNILFLCLSDYKNGPIFAILNIFVDIVAGIFVCTYYFLKIENQARLIGFYRAPWDTVSGVVESVGNEKITYMGAECFEVRIGSRVLLLPASTVMISPGERLVAHFSSGVIVEVER